MKMKLLPALLLSTAISLPVLSDEINVKTTISDATLYSSGDVGASMMRSASVNLPKGRHTLIISGLLIDREYLPSIIGKGVQLIGSRSSEYSTSAGKHSKERQDYLAENKLLDKKITLIDDRRRVLNMKRKYLEELVKQSSKTKIETASPATFIQSALDTLDTQLTKIYSEYVTLQEARAPLAKQKVVLMKNIARVTETEQDYSRITLDVYATHNTKASLSLKYNYQDNEAGWSQNVGARLDSQNNLLTLDVTADLYQESGEHWQDISLTLSSRGKETTEKIRLPSPLYASIRKTIERKRTTATSKRRQEPMRLAPKPNDMDIEEVVVTGARRQTKSAFDTQMTMKVPLTVKSSSDPLKGQIITTLTQDIQVVIQAAPEINTNAYIVARADYDQSFNFFAGKARLIRDGNSLGDMMWPAMIKGQEVDLPFGTTSTISIRKIMEKEDDRNTGFISKTARNETKKQFEVKNNGVSAQTIEVFSSIPIPRTNEITIKVLKSSTKATTTQYNKTPGVIMWRKTLEPGEAWLIKHHYEINSPKGKTIRYKRY